MQGTQYATKRSILCRGAFCGPTKHSMPSHHMYASESPFKWRFTGGPMMARLYNGIWILPLKKTVAKLGALWRHFLDPRMGYI